MRHDRPPVWIGIADRLLCVVGVAVVEAALTKAKIEAPSKGESPITADWFVALNSNVDLWVVGPPKTGVLRPALGRMRVAR